MALYPLPPLRFPDHMGQAKKGFELGVQQRRQPVVEQQADAIFASQQAAAAQNLAVSKANQGRTAEANAYGKTQRGAAEETVRGSNVAQDLKNQQRKSQIDRVKAYEKDRDDDILTEEEMARKYPRLTAEVTKSLKALTDETQRAIKTNMNLIAATVQTGQYPVALRQLKDFKEGLENSKDTKDQEFAKGLDGAIKTLEDGDFKAGHKQLMKAFGFIDYALGGTGKAYDEHFGRNNLRAARFKSKPYKNGLIVTENKQTGEVTGRMNGKQIAEEDLSDAIMAATKFETDNYVEKRDKTDRNKTVEALNKQNVVGEVKVEQAVDQATKIGDAKLQDAEQLAKSQADIKSDKILSDGARHAKVAGWRKHAELVQDRKHKPGIAEATAIGTEVGKIVGQAKAVETEVQTQFDRSIKLAKDIMAHDGLMSQIGTVKGQNIVQFFSRIALDSGADVGAMIDQLKARVFITARPELKGGGHITDYEGDKAQDARIRMQTAVSGQAFITALKDYVVATREDKLNFSDKVRNPHVRTPEDFALVKDGGWYTFNDAKTGTTVVMQKPRGR